MDEAVRTVPLPAPGEPALRTPHAALHVVGPPAPLPDGWEVAFPLPDGARVAYVPAAPGAASPREVAPDPFLRGNAFRPLHESARCLAALLSVAAARRLDTGPESERVFVWLRGSGLVFLESGDSQRFAPGEATVAPPGEPLRVWAQGPDDVLAIVLQPRMAPAERRTLAGEVARRRGES